MTVVIANEHGVINPEACPARILNGTAEEVVEILGIMGLDAGGDYIPPQVKVGPLSHDGNGHVIQPIGNLDGAAAINLEHFDDGYVDFLIIHTVEEQLATAGLLTAIESANYVSSLGGLKARVNIIESAEDSNRFQIVSPQCLPVGGVMYVEQLGHDYRMFLEKASSR